MGGKLKDGREQGWRTANEGNSLRHSLRRSAAQVPREWRCINFDVEIAVGRCLHSLDERLAGRVTFEAPKFFGRNNHDLVATMHGDVLRTLASYLADEFAEARLRIAT